MLWCRYGSKFLYEVRGTSRDCVTLTASQPKISRLGVDISSADATGEAEFELGYLSKNSLNIDTRHPVCDKDARRTVSPTAAHEHARHASRQV